MKYTVTAFFLSLIFLTACSYCQWSDADKKLADSAAVEGQAISYVIKKGDNLWDVTFKFLGDPFRWPEVWRRNPYIKNPNLIYPGATLVIGGAAGLAARQTAQRLTSETQEMKNAPVDREAARETAALPSKKSGAAANLDDSRLFVALSVKAFLTAENVERVGFLWFGKDRKGLLYPGNAVLEKSGPGSEMTKYSSDVYRQFDEIPMTVFGDNPYKIGDTVDILHSDRFVKFKGKTANLVRRTGRARITAVSGGQCTAILFKAWDVVAAGDRVDAMAHFQSREIDTLIDCDVSIRGTVFDRIEETERPYLFQTFLVDRGAVDGVRFGDLFVVYPRESAETPKRPEAIGCVINAGEESSTLCVEKLYENSLEAADTVDLVKRIRFK